VDLMDVYGKGTPSTMWKIRFFTIEFPLGSGYITHFVTGFNYKPIIVAYEIDSLKYNKTTILKLLFKDNRLVQTQSDSRIECEWRVHHPYDI
jgi:hypothetical protein